MNTFTQSDLSSNYSRPLSWLEREYPVGLEITYDHPYGTGGNRAGVIVGHPGAAHALLQVRYKHPRSGQDLVVTIPYQRVTSRAGEHPTDAAFRAKRNGGCV